MSQRPEDLQRRLAGLEQIGQVTGALRAIASGQSSAARGAMAAVSAHAQVVATALSTAATLAEPRHGAGHGPDDGPGLLLVIGAAQGFSGAYPTRIAEAAKTAHQSGGGLVVIGHRTLAALNEAGLPVLWSADLAAHPESVPELASQISDALMSLLVDHPGPIRAVLGSLTPAAPPEIRRLFPPEVTASGQVPPLLTLPPVELLRGLLHEALFAAIALALMQGLAAEAQARMQAMARARSHLDERRTALQSDWQQARQDQMTTEMIELAGARPQAADGAL